ncbi:DedA family protein [Ammoniphilus resinae]|uniref:Membrane protein DedA with SNARE-associated domain n=1 Tax=Ammoniphilus resinae TaxID=861532 RepID=A0ABS4GN46_9BACL|nr:DedA family protein [Ammoniphilus resinae]MBP1931671.1 membrane protein DedA with SNARE-associated domain [Ammoniphilus resinae]
MTEIIHSILLWLTDLGYFGIALGLMIEVIPSEIVLAYGGYMISQGKITFIGAVIAGTVGGTIAQLFLYWLGYYGGRPFLEKYGRFLLIKKKQIDLSELWFNKYGPGVIFTARFVPIVRHAISIPAGIARMSFLKFTVYTTLAVLPWSIFFIYIGHQLGNNWEKFNDIAKPYIQPIIAIAVIILVIYLGYSLLKKRKAT